jgi:hypothetical protein
MSHMSHGATDLTNFIPDAQAALKSGRSKLESMLERIEAALDRYFGEDEATMLNCLRGLR